MRMKFVSGILLMTVAGMALWLLPSCVIPIGGCRYYELPLEKGEVTVLSVTKVRDSGRDLYGIETRGHLKRRVILSPAEFDKCNGGRGIKVGDKMTGIIVPGSPCPPMYKLEGCSSR